MKRVVAPRFNVSGFHRAVRLCIVAAGCAVPAGVAVADPIVALTGPVPVLNTQTLMRFDSDFPTLALPGPIITGLSAGETILGIDFRPANGELFGLGSTGRLYVINLDTGVATQRGSGTFSIPLNGNAFGFDFNPTVDRIRITSDAGQNLRANPNDGAIVDGNAGMPGVQPDGNLRYAAGDPSDGLTPVVVASGYTNSFFGTTSTTLFNLDMAQRTLVRQAPPNDGVLNTVAAIGIDLSEDASFDISANGNTAFITGPGDLPLTVGFYHLDLVSGLTQLVGNIGVIPGRIMGIAVQPSTCPCDFNHDYALGSQDFFDFMTSFWASETRADFNRDAAVNSQDFFDFLTCFFGNACEVR